MKNKINVGKLRKVILILAFLAITAIVVMLVLLNNPTDKKIRYIYDESQVINVSQMAENVNAIFENYNGNASHRTIHKSMYTFVDEVIEKYYLAFKDNFEIQNIEKYFDRNSEEIKEDLLIETKEEFTEFINSVNVLNGEELKLKQYIVIPESIKNVPRGIKYVIAVDYENNERLMFEVTLRNVVFEEYSPLKYNATDDTYKDYQLKKEETGVPEGYVSNTISTGRVVN